MADSRNSTFAKVINIGALNFNNKIPSVVPITTKTLCIIEITQKN